ncbi:hypothetical protein EE612_009273 [Oryza sativa]|nr:hypothetical protein EE612_009273 [Oryza sativa]
MSWAAIENDPGVLLNCCNRCN